MFNFYNIEFINLTVNTIVSYNFKSNSIELVTLIKGSMENKIK